jgi:translation initiation factor 2B subunit (eIF-2B alpha/beta/delta family)
VCDKILEQTAKAASKAKDQEIAALCQKLEEVQQELEEARQGKVSLREATNHTLQRQPEPENDSENDSPRLCKHPRCCTPTPSPH